MQAEEVAVQAEEESVQEEESEGLAAAAGSVAPLVRAAAGSVWEVAWASTVEPAKVAAAKGAGNRGLERVATLTTCQD